MSNKKLFMNSDIIICGSRKYKKANFDNIVDSFQKIVRINMLLPGSGYGKRLPTLQIVNGHVYKNFVTSPTKNLSFYTKQKKITKEHIDKFTNLLNVLGKKGVTTFPNNNTHLFKKLIVEKNINIKIEKEIRCGLSYIPCCIEAGIKPFLIGFSLQEQQMKNNAYTNCLPNQSWHDTKTEIKLIKTLHELNLIDASLCCLKDQENIELDSCSTIQPTQYITEYLKKH